MRREWDEEKQRILDSLVGVDEDLDIPAEREVCIITAGWLIFEDIKFWESRNFCG